MPQCTATAKRTGARCLLPARPGYPVCRVHGSGKGLKRGGRPPIHGAYSKFLRPEEVEDFAHFRAHFSLDDDLAFAATKVYHASTKVDPQQLPSLLEVPSKIAERRKRVLEGTVLTVNVDMQLLRDFVAEVLTYVTESAARQRLLAYLETHLGSAPAE